MARKLKLYGIYTYHTFSRCVNQENMMKDKHAKELMITVLEETLRMFRFELSGFEILDNHFHFIIKTVAGGDSISKIMQRIKSVFAKRYNKMNGRIGPVWNERYGWTIIELAKKPAQYLLHVLWYIACNSYRKNYVNAPRDYEYGSINCYLNDNYQPRLTITIHEFFLLLGNTFNERIKKFLAYKKTYINGLWCQRWGL